VIDEAPLRQAMYVFSRNVLVVALLIAGLTAGLVYLALHYLFVRPMRRLDREPDRLPREPGKRPRASSCRARRGDERIGVAERGIVGYAARTSSRCCIRRAVLAALGLRSPRSTTICGNLLASSQLLSDQLASVPDPRVQRFAPKLMRSLGAARSLSASRRCPMAAPRRRLPDRRMMLVEPVGAEVRETAGLATEASITWINAIERGLTIDADPDQLFRVLLNLVRNAAQALENPAKERPSRPCRSASPAAAKARSVFWKFPTPAPACRQRRASICSRRSRAPAGRAAAG